MHDIGYILYLSFTSYIFRIDGDTSSYVGRLVSLLVSYPSNREALHGSLTLRASSPSPSGSLLVCGSVKEECLPKCQGNPEVESVVIVVSLSLLSEVLLLENIFTQLSLSFLSLKLEKKDTLKSTISSFPCL